jgi:hypothetical protein
MYQLESIPEPELLEGVIIVFDTQYTTNFTQASQLLFRFQKRLRHLQDPTFDPETFYIYNIQNQAYI